MKIILASASPRRRELLKSIGVDNFEIAASNIDEEAARTSDSYSLVMHLAEQKARDVAKSHRNDIVIAADTIVTLDGTPIGKPKDETDAVRILNKLSGRAHKVITGVAVMSGGKIDVREDVTLVYFRKLMKGEAEWYVSTGEPMDKAGAYGIQGLGGLFIERIEGSYSNVVGLPVCMLADMLRSFGVNLTGVTEK